MNANNLNNVSRETVDIFRITAEKLGNTGSS
jgi:hypothetical protein